MSHTRVFTNNHTVDCNYLVCWIIGCNFAVSAVAGDIDCFTCCKRFCWCPSGFLVLINYSHSLDVNISMHIWWMTTFKDQNKSPIRNAFKMSVKEGFQHLHNFASKKWGGPVSFNPPPVQMYTGPRHSGPHSRYRRGMSNWAWQMAIWQSKTNIYYNVCTIVQCTFFFLW